MPIKYFMASLLFAAIFSVWGCFHKHPRTKTCVDSLRPAPAGMQNGQDTGYRQHHAPPLLKQDADTLIECSGTLEIPSSNRIWITPPASGVVHSIHCFSGNYVQKGTILATIENIEFLKLQQEYLEAKSQYFYYGEEMKRQGELTIENASSIKKLQQAQLAYQVWDAKIHSLAQQLILIGFTPDSIDVYHLSPLISIMAPESGYIYRIVALQGRRIDPGERLLEMVRNNKPILALEIPEEYYAKLKVGQQLVFYLRCDSSIAHKAKLTYINRYIEPGSHIVRAVAMPDDHSLLNIPGMHVGASLFTGQD